MKFLIAPNAFKGSLSAIRAANIIAETIRRIDPTAETFLCPVADGGNGTLDSLIHATGGTIHRATVRGPISMHKVDARWGILGDGTTAVIEMAEASGLHLLQRSEYDVSHATTFGVGELIREAIQKECRKILIGLGGSATNDGGAGCARAFGAKFFDEQGKELDDGGIHLSKLKRIEINNGELRIKNVEVVGLSDVTNELCGPNGAAYTFAAQKGATTEQISQLDEALRHYASIIKRECHQDVSHIPGSGSAGGLGAGLITFFNARIVSGIDFVLDTLRFNSLVERCDCVITAEGTIDTQTVYGKGIEGVARRARLFGKPVHAFAGRIDGDTSALRQRLGLATLMQISPQGIPTEEAMKGAKTFLSKSVESCFSTMNPFK